MRIKKLDKLIEKHTKEFRDIVGLAIKEYKGLDVSDSDSANALTKIKSIASDKREKFQELRKDISEELKERKQMREQLKSEREEAKETSEEERDSEP